MIEWLNRHKKGIMTYTLWLVIPSFVLLYGYGQCSMPEMIPWVVKVNNERINQWELHNWERMIRDRIEENNPDADIDPDELRRQALETAIYSMLFRQKAREWGVDTTDAEVAASIRNVDWFHDDNNQFNYNYYLFILRSSGYTPEEFEAQQRESLTRTKVEAFLRQSAKRAVTETQRRKERERIEAEIEFLAFEPSRYVDEVEVDEEKLLAFFEENIEDYRIPEKRRIAFTQFFPTDYYDEVEIDDSRLQRFFERNRHRYELPEQYTVEFITYTPEVFVAQVQAEEEEIDAKFNANPERYRTNERVRIRYAAQPLPALAEIQEVTEEVIRQYYEDHEYLYEHEEQVKASHILLRLEETASEEDDESVRERLLEIRQSILDGEITFADAAHEYSEDPSAEINHGDLGWFGRGRMVPPFEEAAFTLPLNEVSEPVRTSLGYHLILVEDRREAGKDSLDDVRDDIRKDLQRQRAVEEFTRLAETLNSLDDVADRFELRESEWIERGSDEFSGDMANLPRFEKMMISSTAFRTFPEANVRMAGNAGSENLYLIEVIERQESRPMTLSEARERIVEDVRQEKALAMADQFVQEDIERIRNEGATMEEIAELRELYINTSPRFTRETQFVPSLGQGQTLVSALWGLGPGQVTGPVRTQLGQFIVRLLAKEDPRLPELIEVRDRVVQDYMRSEAERLARGRAIEFDINLFESQRSILEAAAEFGIEAATTELFALGEVIPGISPSRNVNRMAFELQRIGQNSDRPIEERTSQGAFGGDPARDSVAAYYIIELLEIQESDLPSLDDVREDVVEDYRLRMAEEIAIAKAQATLEGIKVEVAAGEPVDASRTVDLVRYSDSENVIYHEPTRITGSGQVPGVGSAPAIAKTAISLEPGQVSDIIRHYRYRTMPDNARVRGPLAGVYILQVLDKSIRSEEEDAPTEDFFERFIAEQQGRLAASAWIEEVSAASEIVYNQNYFADFEDLYEDEIDEGATVDEIASLE